MDHRPKENEQRLHERGLKFDDYVDSAEGSPFLFDEDLVEQRSELARQRLLGDEIPYLGAFGNERSQRVQSVETGAPIVSAARALRAGILKIRSKKET
jgi:hypothetical protein